MSDNARPGKKKETINRFPRPRKFREAFQCALSHIIEGVERSWKACRCCCSCCKFVCTLFYSLIAFQKKTLPRHVNEQYQLIKKGIKWSYCLNCKTCFHFPPSLQLFSCPSCAPPPASAHSEGEEEKVASNPIPPTLTLTEK